MTDTQNIQQVLDKAESLLKSMGKTGVEVAEFLKSRGIKGQPDNSSDDPVARFLKAELGADDVSIEFGSAFIYAKGGWDNDVSLPEAVDEFLGDFDNGKYPDLVG